MDEDNEESLTIDFRALLEAEDIEVDGLKAPSARAKDLLLDVTELDATEPFCKPEPPLPAGAPIEEKRAHPRFLVNWKVVVMNEINGKRQFFHGRASDISMGGLCLLSDHNLLFAKPITVLVSVPPSSAKYKPHVIDVVSKITYTVLAHDVRQFRIGIRFLKFKEGDKRYLERYFAERFDAF